MSADPDIYDDEPENEPPSFAHLLDELELYATRPFEDETDPRPLPSYRQVAGVAADTFDAMVSTLEDTRLEPDLEDLLWHMTNVFQRAVERVERELDTNEQAQRRLQREQDGSEVRSVELEMATRIGRTMIERRDSMEAFRDAFAEQFRAHIRKPWLPHSGSKVNRKALTSAVVDSRDFINAKRWADKQVLIPPGKRIYFSGGAAYNDHALIFEVLDKTLTKIPDMVLLHGDAKTGAEKIAKSWAGIRGVPQVPFSPDFKKHSRASAPFKRNDEVLQQNLAGVIVFPGGGIQDNLFDKARAMGITRWDFRGRG